jgi:hypothetical protein
MPYFLLLCPASSLRLAELSLTASDSQQMASCFFNSGHRRDGNEFHKTYTIFHMTSSCIFFKGSQLTVVLSVSSRPNLLSTRRRKSGDCALKAIFHVFQRMQFFCLWRYCNGPSFRVFGIKYYGCESLYSCQTPFPSVFVIHSSESTNKHNLQNSVFPSYLCSSSPPISGPFFQRSPF